MSEGPIKKTIRAKITLGPTKDLPLLYAHQVVVNFTGSEFYVTVYASAPEPWTSAEIAHLEIEARPLARFAFSPTAWLAGVESCWDQIQKLEAEGAITSELRASARKLLST